MAADGPTQRPLPSNGVPSGRFGPGLLLGTVAVAAMIGVWEGGKAPDGSSVAYADRLAAGLPTVCAGLTRHVTTTPIVVGERWPAAKCLAEERRAVMTLQRQLERCFVMRPPQAVFESATSHAWNNGVGSTCGSLAMQAWRAGDWELGCRRIAFSDSGRRVWSYVRTGRTGPDGRPEMRFVQGLANRRDAEAAYCLSGVRDTHRIQI